MLSHGLRKLSLARGWVDARRTVVRRTSRHQWFLTPAGEKLFGDDGPDLDGWIRDNLCTLVKQGSQRTVYRVRLPGSEVFAKRCRINGLRAWGRELLRPAKARLEFENAVMLRDLGLPAVEPLAWARLARHGPGESIFITRCEEGAGPLQIFLDEVFARRIPGHLSHLRGETSRELGILMARLHDAGVAHPDPHPGNLLVAIRGGTPTFTLIDLHAIRFGPPLSWRESLSNLVLFNRWFQLRANRSDRLRFWQAYVAHRTTLPAASPHAVGRMAAQLERRTMSSNARFWMARFPRYQKCSRHVNSFESNFVCGFAVPDLPPKFVERLAADLDAPFRDPAASVLKDSPTSMVVEISIPAPNGPRTAVYKRFSPRSPLTVLKNYCRPSAALRSWLNGHNLLDRSLPTARPLCVLERRRGIIFRAEGYLLAEKVQDAQPLHDASSVADWRMIREAATRIGQLLRHLHEKRVRHRDLKASNILINSRLEPYFIDLVGVSPDSRPLTKAIRIRDVARLAASFLNSQVVTRSDKLRVLRAYRAWGLHGRKGWKAWWRAIDAAIQRKQAKNARRGRPLA